MKFESLFCDADTAWIVISHVNNHHAPNTGILAFAYPGKTYGYSAHLEITAEDIPALITYAEAKGMQLNSNDGDIVRYCYPGSKWWTDFPQTTV